MWTVKTQFNKPNKETPTSELEWSAVTVDTQAAAEQWWNTRTVRPQRGSVSTMMDPTGAVVRVQFG
jgi:hypothetical protein